jgi:hypothetical protein
VTGIHLTICAAEFSKSANQIERVIIKQPGSMKEVRCFRGISRGKEPGELCLVRVFSAAGSVSVTAI